MSPQQTAVLRALERAGARGLTSLELTEQTHVLHYTQRVKELRDKHGYAIEAVAEDIPGGRRYRYRLVGREEAGQVLPPVPEPHAGAVDLFGGTPQAATSPYLADAA
jgi:hypothetical protein